MVKPTHVLLKHPKTDATWHCPVGAVDVWLDKGWTKAPDEAAPAAAKTDQEPAKASSTGKDK
ncbi:hypothetical protein [Glycomyces artemisiae]|uniref:Uncharacterized protein n=1 Tax=Glycomyces artemisiae TaxID=1076443 RepID=A0A2T0UF14_9ACTN|nr:hypothetical protein [Glycomyces artemisiae]PRY56438.1 hypothetical protein B0I28_10987 [Glycomyces artemisiae]